MDYIKPELVVLSVALYFLGVGIKKTGLIKNKWIPLINGIIGIIFASIYVVATSTLTTTNDILMAIFVGFTQGIICAGLSVYTNQLIKQFKQ